MPTIEEQAFFDRMDALLQASAPDVKIDTALTTCLLAWGDVDTERHLGMAVGPIPFTAIVAWASLYELDLDATIVLKDAIRVADADRMAAARAKGGK